MKRKFLITAGTALVAFSGYLGVRISEVMSSSDLQMANVEALVRGEGDGRYKCYSSVEYEEGAKVVICDTCESEYDMTDKWNCIHDWCYR